MKFRLEIQLGNEAMQTRLDLETALRPLGHNLAYMCDPPEDGDEGTIRDENGNTVGKWEVVEDKPARLVYDEDNWPPPMR